MKIVSLPGSYHNEQCLPLLEEANSSQTEKISQLQKTCDITKPSLPEGRGIEMLLQWWETASTTLQRCLQVLSFRRRAHHSSDVGIAMGGGTDIAITDAKFILMPSTLMLYASNQILISDSNNLNDRLSFANM